MLAGQKRRTFGSEIEQGNAYFRLEDKEKNMNNYIPIALISNLAKIFEKIIHSRILDFTFEHEIISSRQYGFLKGKSTDDAVAELSNFIYENLKNSNPAIVTYLDYSKPFDSINHGILLNQLYNMGTRGVCLSLIQSYLLDRAQLVKVNGTKILPIKITREYHKNLFWANYFYVCINDLLILLKVLLAHADDTAVSIQGKTWALVAATTSIKLDVIYFWLYQNRLVLYVQKSVFITFRNYADSVPTVIELEMNGQNISRVTSAKYLGLTYDCNMKWDIHVDNIVKKPST